MQQSDLTIHYVYQDGTTAAPTHSVTLPIHGAYDVASPELPGYTPSMARVTGTMPARSVTYTVIYLKAGTNRVFIGEHATPQGMGAVHIGAGMSMGDCFE
ncbi:MAG: MucBP domain-containing protein [Oscillospiraceae bacterium]|nr:MucBP domain-containing protein [Oscillospiraceae bacterium]